MSKIRSVAVLACMLWVVNPCGAAFLDDFNRANGPVGNGWTTQTNGTIKVEIVDNEVLIAGTQATDWVRCGLHRPVSGETRIAFDFLANDRFNFHCRVDSADSSAYVEIYCWPGGPMTHANSLDGGWPGWVEIPGSNMTAGEYNNFVLEQDGTTFTITLNGKVVGSVTNANFTSIERVLLSSDAAAGTTGSLHFDNVQIGEVIAGAARDPSPALNATDVPRDVVLGWTPGEYANTHNVYLGTTFDDVNNADIAQAASAGQTQMTFRPAGLLEYDQTYYWRVDEVNAPPDSTVIRGEVWNFTTEPYAYSLTGVTVTASSSNIAQGMTAQKTIDGSGFNSAAGTHASTDVDMWLTATGTTLPGWIQYEFSQARLVQQMKVWNSNQKIEPFVGFGAREVLIETSLDGETWTELKTVELAQADGTDTYAGSVIDMGVLAKFVRLTIQTSWGGFVPQAGLSEVRFLYVPVQAREPSPAMYAENVSVDTAFDWREGRFAASHKVYFSTDKAAVADGTALVDTTTESAYQPPSLDFGSTYSWRVDEVNDAPESDYSGNVWEFITTEFAAIDDFESYTNDSPDRVFQAWIDGWGFSPDDFFPNGDAGNGTSSLVGYDPAVGNIMETSVIHGGAQSMPVEYNNVNAPYYSEIERTWTSSQNWTTNGATDVALWFRGNPAKFNETADGHMVVSAYGGDVWGSADHFNFVYKRLSGDGSISAKVNSIAFAANWSKAGVMIRESLDPSSSHGFMLVTPQNRRAFQNRPTTGGSSVSAHGPTNNITLPFWVKVERKGNQITASYSTDGTTWTVQPDTENTGGDASPNPQTITMGASVYIGVAVSSNVPSTGPCVADLSDIVTSASVTGAWQVADVGGDNPANDPDTMYVMIQDSSGKSKTVVHPDPRATCTANWTQWLIPLKDLTGVNMAAVRKMVIGIGDRNAPKPGAAGMLYIDDIQYGKPVVPVGLVAHYAMEDNADDSSGNGHNGAIVGEPVFVDGAVGKAVQFNGAIGQFVELGTFNPSATTGKLSVSLWANWKGPTGLYQGLIAKRNYWSPTDMMWQIEANNAAGALTFARNGTTTPSSGNPILPVGEWAHVAVTFDKTTARFYVNGAMTGQGGFSFGPNREASMHIGACDVNGGNPFNGAIDEVRLYDIALSAAEVAALAGK